MTVKPRKPRKPSAAQQAKRRKQREIDRTAKASLAQNRVVERTTPSLARVRWLERPMPE